MVEPEFKIKPAPSVIPATLPHQMTIEARYQQILQDLKQDKRALFRPSPEEVRELQKILTKNQHDLLLPAFCLLDHTETPYQEFIQPLLELLKQKNLPAETLIYALGASLKHIVTYYERSGEKLPADFITAVRGLLTRKEPELLEWVLRVISSLGALSKIFKNDILPLTPGLTALFNQHKRAVLEIITYLERQWSLKS